MASPLLPSQPPVEGGRQGLAEGLRELAGSDLEVQGIFWKRVAEKLRDAERIWYLSTVAQCDGSHYDALGRYFDATPAGLSYIYRKQATEQGLDRQGFCDVLVHHFGFSKEKVSLDALSEVCDKAESSSGFMSENSFGEVMRKLRIGMLLVSGYFNPEMAWTSVWLSEHCDKQWDLKIMQYDEGDKGHIDQLNELKQKCHFSPGQERFQPIKDFVFDNPHDRTKGKVQWLHIHQPDTSLILALGQQFHLRLNVLGVLCRIDEVPPQIDDVTDKAAAFGTSNWSSVVFPCVHLDGRSRRLLEMHKRWRKLQEQRARENSDNSNTRNRARQVARRDKDFSGASSISPADFRAGKTPSEEPPIFVGVIQVTQVLLWAGTTLDGEAIVSSLGVPSYLGYWVASTKGPEDGNFLQGLRNLLPCTRRSQRPDQAHAHDGYQLLEQEDVDDEEAPAARSGGHDDLEHRIISKSCTVEEVEELMQDSRGQLGLLRYQQEAEENTTFVRFYDDILQQLKTENSVLRMGNHFHLLIRIILDGTTEYIDVLDLYEIVIAKCKTKLGEPHYRDGPHLMAMISLSKTELTSILRSLEGFQDRVLPRLCELCQIKGVEHEATLSERIVQHHMIDIKHNIAQVVRECHSQIHICETLIDDYDRKTADKANNILNILTFITFLMVPMQLLTGYYGMNFAHGFPELRHKEGHLFFWGLATAGTIFMACTMVFLNRTY